MDVESLRNKSEKSSSSPSTTRMEHQQSSSDAARVVRNRRIRRNIFIAVIGLLGFIVILLVILAFTVFKAKNPITTVDDVSLTDLKFNVDLARLRVLLNVTLDVDLSIKNPNKVGFKYTNSTAQLNYRGQQVGEVPIPAGKISAENTIPMNLTLTVMADRFISDSRFFADATTGELPLNTMTKVSGKVNVLSVFKIHVVSSASCDFILFLSNLSVGGQDCKYKTSF